LGRVRESQQGNKKRERERERERELGWTKGRERRHGVPDAT
jgi:hypothetical protein